MDMKVALGMMTGENDNDLLDLLLERAKNIILANRYPVGNMMPDTIEPRYLDLQLRIAEDLYRKMGVEYEPTGISKKRDTTNVSESLLREITPIVGV